MNDLLATLRDELYAGMMDVAACARLPAVAGRELSLLNSAAGHFAAAHAALTEQIAAVEGRENDWRPISRQPEYNQRACRQFVIVEGWKEHSGVTWSRAAWGVAYIRHQDDPECLLGYKRSDIERIMREGDMDGVERIDWYMPARMAPFPPSVR